ncbi:response regulator [candidate division GN15 bacterium]|nr:response regulator [candidate division GN15 bacterium]
MAQILVVDDEPKMTSLICGTLEDAGHRVTTTTDPAEALGLIENHAYDIVITDLSMPKVSGMEIMEAALTKGGAEVIMMTAYGTAESAVRALKAGAADYLLKPFSFDELEHLVARLAQKQKLSSLSEHYQQELKARTSDTFIGESAAAQKVKELVQKVAATDATVLVSGKSGTGKELVARMVHELSSRRERPFIAINCAALTETLLESELFGHEKGAFTGATARKRGRFELADTGTIFLDEIAEMAPNMQSKLLRVLEEGKLDRVGGVDLIDIDVRVVAATNRDLRSEIAQGRFREDLFFRLNVFPIQMPSLAERREDIPALAEHFLAQQRYRHGTLSDEVKSLLMSYDWPGNVRELRNVLERAIILAGDEPLSPEEFSLEAADNPIIVESTSKGVGEKGLESAEKEMILDALSRAKGNKTEAAKLLKITRRRLYSRMKAHDIEP